MYDLVQSAMQHSPCGGFVTGTRPDWGSNQIAKKKYTKPVSSIFGPFFTPLKAKKKSVTIQPPLQEAEK